MSVITNFIINLLRKDAQRHLLYGSRKKALALFQRIYNLSPTIENQFSLGLCLMNLRRYAEAAALMQPIQDKLPDQVFAGTTYAQCLLLSRRFEDSLQVYQRLNEQNPGKHTLPLMLNLLSDPIERDKVATSLDLQLQASLLQEEKQYQTALDMLQTASGLTPDDAVLHNNIGSLKLKLKYAPEEIMKDFARAMSLNPENDQFKRNYRKVWQKIKK